MDVAFLKQIQCNRSFDFPNIELLSLVRLEDLNKFDDLYKDIQWYYVYVLASLSSMFKRAKNDKARAEKVGFIASLGILLIFPLEKTTEWLYVYAAYAVLLCVIGLMNAFYFYLKYHSEYAETARYQVNRDLARKLFPLQDQDHRVDVKLNPDLIVTFRFQYQGEMMLSLLELNMQMTMMLQYRSFCNVDEAFASK